MAIVTPRIGNLRLKLDVSNDDLVKIKRGRGWKAIITDRKTGKMYRLRAASCGVADCYCDAIATEIKSRG